MTALFVNLGERDGVRPAGARRRRDVVRRDPGLAGRQGRGARHALDRRGGRSGGGARWRESSRGASSADAACRRASISLVNPENPRGPRSGPPRGDRSDRSGPRGDRGDRGTAATGLPVPARARAARRVEHATPARSAPYDRDDRRPPRAAAPRRDRRDET
jgi:hypothetical protein